MCLHFNIGSVVILQYKIHKYRQEFTRFIYFFHSPMSTSRNRLVLTNKIVGFERALLLSQSLLRFFMRSSALCTSYSSLNTLSERTLQTRHSQTTPFFLFWTLRSLLFARAFSLELLFFFNLKSYKNLQHSL